MGASQILESVADLSYLVLTGGRSSRFGSDKQNAVLAGKPLLDRIISQIPEEHKIFISGTNPTKLSREVFVIPDDIKYLGPVAGLAQVIDFIESKYVAVLATDIPYGPHVIHYLITRITEFADGFVPLDGDGVLQSLCAIYRTSKLRLLLQNAKSTKDRSMKSLLQELQIEAIKLPIEKIKYLTDIDTPRSLYLANEMFKNELSE